MSQSDADFFEPSSSSIMQDVINLAAARASFTAYIPVQCTSELHGASMAKFALSAEDVLHMHHLANIASKVGAPEITMMLYCEWSSTTIETVTNRFSISPPLRKDSDTLAGTDVSIECHEACGSGVITSSPLRLKDIATQMVDAHKAGKTEIMMDPEHYLTLEHLEDYFPTDTPIVDRPV